MGTIARQTIIDAVVETLRPVPAVRAVWLGGSDATGRTDAWSDVDLQVLAEDGAVETVFEAVRGAVETLSPIAHRWRLPSPTWHGHEQEILSLRDASPHHFLDLVVMARSAPDRFLDEDRHGRPVVLLDRDGEIRPGRLDRDAHARRLEARRETLRETFPLLQPLVTRAVRRGQPAVAILAYVLRTLTPLVEALRMVHCPDRFDFGLRYLDRDLPEDVRREVEGLALPRTLEEVETFRERAGELFAEAIEKRTPGARPHV